MWSRSRRRASISLRWCVPVRMAAMRSSQATTASGQASLPDLRISTFLNHTMATPCMDSLIMSVLMCAVFGAYFCCFVRMKLSRFYDENNVNIFYDGPFRMHVPGVNFNNRNWPHIVQAFRLSLCLSMILMPILNLLASSVAVVVWENIGRYVLVVIMLCSIFLPIYVVGKKYE